MQLARRSRACTAPGQRFGVNYLIDVLTGKPVERVKRFGHDQQSTYGIGSDMSATEWRSLFRQLIAGGLLGADGHGSLQLTEESRPVLRGEQALQLRKLNKRSSRSASGRTLAHRPCHRHPTGRRAVVGGAAGHAQAVQRAGKRAGLCGVQ